MLLKSPITMAFTWILLSLSKIPLMPQYIFSFVIVVIVVGIHTYTSTISTGFFSYFQKYQSVTITFFIVGLTISFYRYCNILFNSNSTSVERCVLSRHYFAFSRPLDSTQIYHMQFPYPVPVFLFAIFLRSVSW